MAPQWVVELLSKAHDRSAFDCGEESLNEYLKKFAKQHAEKDINRTYIALIPPQLQALGYYSLSSGSIDFDNLPVAVSKKLPKYPLPSAHLARLGVDQSCQGKVLGGFLLIDAFRRVTRLSDEIGICAITVDALHQKARDFYLRFGFQSLLDDELHLYLMMGTVRKLKLT